VRTVFRRLRKLDLQRVVYIIALNHSTTTIEILQRNSYVVSGRDPCISTTQCVAYTVSPDHRLFDVLDHLHRS
jgi:hypothetical protein